MSWQAYVDDSLIKSGKIDKGAIFSAAGDSVWAVTPGFNVGFLSGVLSTVWFFALPIISTPHPRSLATLSAKNTLNKNLSCRRAYKGMEREGEIEIDEIGWNGQRLILSPRLNQKKSKPSSVPSPTPLPSDRTACLLPARSTLLLVVTIKA
jgi:hypothetical protein